MRLPGIAARRALLLTGLLLALAVVVIVRASAPDPYTVRLPLADAGGLRKGAQVVAGGVPIGKVSALQLARAGDRAAPHVVAVLDIDHGKGPVGRNATATIAAVNLLGLKRVELDTGQVSDPLPSGATLVPRQVHTSTDLDQVLGVLDAGTRARLAILLNETGSAVLGRQHDLEGVVGLLPQTIEDGTRIFDQVAQDNHTLGQLVARSDQVIGQFAARRRDAGEMIDRVGQTAATVNAKRAQLGAALDAAPATLAQLTGFLDQLRTTSAALGPAARRITATAPTLGATVAAIDPFRKAADPTLDAATSVAPALTRLGTRATPVLAQARPVLADLSTASQSLRPVSGILDHSADNLFAILENWSRAIQLRDGLGHVFRAAPSVSPDTLRSLMAQTAPAGDSKQRHAKPAEAAATPAPSGGQSQPSGSATQPAPSTTLPSLPGLVHTVTGKLPKLLPPTSAPAATTGQGGSGDPGKDLLDYLLG